ncbi:hypothetical protein GUY59_03720 [Nonomuraea sp. K271]|nr:hypothetical protein [Nonomuraea sp. K271]
MHGYHRRRLADRPVDGLPIVIELRLRRLVCLNLECTRQTCHKQVPGLAGRYRRRRLRDQTRPALCHHHHRCHHASLRGRAARSARRHLRPLAATASRGAAYLPGPLDRVRGRRPGRRAAGGAVCRPLAPAQQSERCHRETRPGPPWLFSRHPVAIAASCNTSKSPRERGSSAVPAHRTCRQRPDHLACPAWPAAPAGYHRSQLHLALSALQLPG